MVETFTSKAFRSSRLQMFSKIHRKTPMLESVFNKVAPKETLSQVFSHDFCEILKKPHD